jgi:hypothetical protein
MIARSKGKCILMNHLRRSACIYHTLKPSSQAPNWLPCLCAEPSSTYIQQQRQSVNLKVRKALREKGLAHSVYTPRLVLKRLSSLSWAKLELMP